MRALVLAFLLLAMSLFCFAEQAAALDGDVDTDDMLPFVVIVTADGWECTGVVLTTHVVATAGHCLWLNGKYASDVRVHYKDPHGQWVYNQATEIKVTDNYRHLMVAGTTSYDEVHGTLLNLKNEADQRRSIYEDFGLIYTDVDIPVAGLGYTILDQLVDTKTLLAELDKTNNTWDTGVYAILKNSVVGAIDNGFFGNNKKLLIKVLAAGYGLYDCTDENDNRTCKHDLLRRYQEAILGMPKDMPPFFVWCVPPTTEGRLIEHGGDSGGPLFIRAADGKWLLSGFLSGGGWSETGSRLACSSSLAYHVKFYTDFVNAPRPNTITPDSYYDNGHAEYFLKQILESWSSQNSEHLLRLKSLYKENGTMVSGAPMSLDAIYKLHEEFVTAWPQRSYELLPDNKSFVCNNDKSRLCHVQAKAKFVLQNKEPDNILNGHNILNGVLHMDYVFSFHLGDPIIVSETTAYLPQ
jgi:hypothetical protein